MPPRPLDLLEAIAREPALAGKLRAVASGETVQFSHVVESAQPALAAMIARAGRGRVWLVCANVRGQEQLHNELSQWFPEAEFFPELEVAPVEGAMPDPEIVAERLAVVQGLIGSEMETEAAAGRSAKGKKIHLPPVVVLTRASLGETVVDEEALRKLELRLTRGERCDREALLKKLGDAGYEHVPQVTARGQFAIRGGIVDVFSFHHTLPVRLEFFDEEIESIRQFDLDAQTSVEQLGTCTFLLGEADPRDTQLSDYIRDGDTTVSVDANWAEAQVSITGEIGAGDVPVLEENGVAEETGDLDEESPAPPVLEDFSTAFFDHGLGEFAAGDFVVDEFKRERFFAQLTEWRTQGWKTFVFCNNEGEAERLRELLPAVESDALQFVTGTLARGFTFPAGKVAALSDAELFGRYRNTRGRRLAMRRAREVAHRQQIDFNELIEGELVVHLEHGIARFHELRTVGTEDVLVLEFAEGARLYVPLEQSYLVARYVGIGKRNPPLSKLGDAAWANAKKKAEKAVFDYAGKLLEMHARRESQQGYAFPPDNEWMREFEASFLYKETPDQVTAIADTKTDMENERPMDRLICGDVGFGKTEVAIRAAFKAVCAGKQVAVLVPTTVLAEQHYRTFRERVSDYPITVDMLSRFRTRGQQHETLKGVADGGVDIVIGTHRLISKDVAFKNLGLVVVDEEQRFGVLHKERFKELWPLVDLLTLSATPIPRTLYMSLMGAKDMSTIETPPANRIPVETLICPYDERIIRDAIARELKRGGQVYFLHNRVEDIETVARKIKMLCPNARVLIGHGQMDEHELEEVMHQFVNGAADVLVATTIIESGVDIPNANTIIIDRADRFGLADLYQLRGRVGRAQHKAYAYLMLPRGMISTGEARKRISAIKQYGSLGAGFKIAMRDLEIRGAGNILGTAQSGHIVTIGFDLYCALLRQAIAKLKGQRARHRIEVALRLDFVVQREAEFAGETSEIGSRGHGKAAAFVPTEYLADTQARIAAYRRINEVGTQEALEALRKEWRDRYGRMPMAVENLLLLTELRISAAARKITVVEVKEEKLMLTRNGDFVLIGGKFPRLTARKADERLRELLKMVRSF
jgi:transcription-repair coupling factor (superfamily II helicase)